VKKQKLAFVDHSFHAKTRSGDFLRNIFKDKYIIRDIWVNRDLKFDKDIYKFDNIFFFQIFPPVEVLNKLKSKNLMWAPMYDSPHHPIGFSWILWKIVEHYRIKVLSFSKKLTLQISKYNIKYLDLKYFVKPSKNNKKISNKLDVFFWYRGDIDFDDWSNVLNKKDVRKIIYFDTQSLNRKKLFSKNKKIQYIHKSFANKKDFVNLIKKSDIFVCPRLKEGIGMANVESIALGKYLIANDEVTMSEYIINKKIGIFYNYSNTKKLDIKNVKNFKNYRYNYALNGFKTFEKNKKTIIKLFKELKKNHHVYSAYYLLLFSVKMYTLKRKFLMFLR
jgi:hypothetical protein